MIFRNTFVVLSFRALFLNRQFFLGQIQEVFERQILAGFLIFFVFLFGERVCWKNIELLLTTEERVKFEIITEISVRLFAEFSSAPESDVVF